MKHHSIAASHTVIPSALRIALALVGSGTIARTCLICLLLHHFKHMEQTTRIAQAGLLQATFNLHLRKAEKQIKQRNPCFENDYSYWQNEGVSLSTKKSVVLSQISPEPKGKKKPIHSKKLFQTNLSSTQFRTAPEGCGTAEAQLSILLTWHSQKFSWNPSLVFAVVSTFSIASKYN